MPFLRRPVASAFLKEVLQLVHMILSIILVESEDKLGPWGGSGPHCIVERQLP